MRYKLATWIERHFVWNIKTKPGKVTEAEVMDDGYGDTVPANGYY